MHALPATAADVTPEVKVPAQPAAERAAVDSMPWLYRSEGFAEDLETDPSHEPKPEPPLLRWGLPVIALVGVVGLAAAFSLV